MHTSQAGATAPATNIDTIVNRAGRRLGVDPKWVGSRFEPLALMPSYHDRGLVGEKIAAEFLRSRGFRVRQPWGVEHDLTIWGGAGRGTNSLRVEVKLALEQPRLRFTFNGIDPDLFDLLLLIAVEPNGAYLWDRPARPRPEGLRIQGDRYCISGSIASLTRRYGDPLDLTKAWGL